VEYEAWAEKDTNSLADYRAEIEYDRPIYEYYRLSGRILDCGGGVGTVREFLPGGVEFVSTDPWVLAPFAISPTRKAAYSCLGQPLNFIAATAEFQPFLAESFDWVHMRSMLDHTQVPDLAILEAKRVLRDGGRVLIGLYVVGGKSGRITFKHRVKEGIKRSLELIGIDRYQDHHVWHPSHKELVKLITDNGLEVEDTYWQPHWNDTVCYICARKPAVRSSK
jgi:SAM-dependent methyltransferase